MFILSQRNTIYVTLQKMLLWCTLDLPLSLVCFLFSSLYHLCHWKVGWRFCYQTFTSRVRDELNGWRHMIRDPGHIIYIYSELMCKGVKVYSVKSNKYLLAVAAGFVMSIADNPTSKMWGSRGVAYVGRDSRLVECSPGFNMAAQWNLSKVT